MKTVATVQICEQVNQTQRAVEMSREIRFRIWDTVLKTMMPDFDNWIDFHGNYWTTPDERGELKTRILLIWE